ncbi:hypothetical protein AURDEDRAFT_25094, partial [Auricularia subglabra TFB-10046 SS5]
LPRVHMSSTDTFGPNKTNVKFPWPQDITGLERIVLSTNGSLQRLLSAYFAEQIDAEVVSTHTYYSQSEDDKESKSLPLTQRRIINLICNGTVVCTATSTIVVHSREVADLFDKGFFIGQVIRQLQKTPSFTLLDVNVRDVEEDSLGSSALSSALSTPSTSSQGRKQRLWRHYKLGIEGLECDIEELFMDRDMF